MKDRIKAQLKQQFPGVNLSNQRLDEIAARLTPKVTEESEIEAKLNELNELFPFADLARQDDRIRTLEAQTKKQEPAPKSDEPAPKQTDDTPEWAKALMDEVTALKKEKQQGTIKQQLKEKLKDVPEVFYRHAALPNSVEELDAFADTIQNDYTAFNQERINAMANGKVPLSLGNQGTKAIDDDISAWAKEKD